MSLHSPQVDSRNILSEKLCINVDKANGDDESTNVIDSVIRNQMGQNSNVIASFTCNNNENKTLSTPRVLKPMNLD